MKNLVLSLLTIITLTLNTQAQKTDAWVYFKDKPNASDYLENPTSMLSQRALDRRVKQNIELDITDAPIEQSYLEEIRKKNISIISKSKWFNGIHIQGKVKTLKSLEELDCVKSVVFLNNKFNKRITDGTENNTSEITKYQTQTNKTRQVYDSSFEYGKSEGQITMLNAKYLHEQGFTGKSMQIAIMDAGFMDVDNMKAFGRIRDNNQILDTYNYIDKEKNVYKNHNHGTMVLSSIAGYLENKYIGMAPDASFYLFITEHVEKEHPFEPNLFIQAAEKADSLGVDVISASLGYYEFDDSAYNYDYEDLDGKTTQMTKGVEIAAKKGILLVFAAGNEGFNPWHHISVPADAPNVLTVGAVNKNKKIAGFSSWGPTADGRVKPDVCAFGKGVPVIDKGDRIINANGTSFACPIMAGLVTCLWESMPYKTNKQIIESLRISGNHYDNPDDHYGYGVPDFEMAQKYLDVKDDINIPSQNIKVYPNPIQQGDILNIINNKLESKLDVTFMSLSGQTILSKTNLTNPTTININQLPKGLFIMKIKTPTISHHYKLITN